MREIIALIREESRFRFDVMDVEENLHLILARYGISDEYSIAEEFLLKEGLLPLAIDAETKRSLRADLFFTR